ncbi:AAA family ATPase [Streptomyces sp. HD]|uniref:AAA family ATPase n=1 Tax=Streptomyces sp. HD TaxID=3020892 RepID=UPI00232E6618|nr:LuxR family transcriptional regulator [Streptomyces sp. HD]MDC0768633.1 AAA family ATPase [Streptomyces sp. HD]
MNLVEREKELSIMKGMLDAAMTGHGGVLLVSGAVASGKTALLRAFEERATAAGALLLQATASDAERDMPLGVMGQLLLAMGAPHEGVVGAARSPDGAALPAAVVTELCGIVLEKAREKPVMLIVDDVHHIDSYSVECLFYLARRMTRKRILMVLAESSSGLFDSSRVQVDFLRLPGCRNIRLGPLTRRGVGDMTGAHGGERWRTRALVAHLHRTGGGNPLLTKALLEDTAVSLADGDAHEPDACVPGESYERAVTACLYRGDPALRHLARALAVLGPQAAPAELAEVLGTGRESVHRGLSALGATGLLGTGWFRHEAGRCAVLRGMEPADRARLEARVATVLHEHGRSATVVARHLMLAERVDDVWALPTLLEAADRALADDDVALALSCLRAARDLCTDEGRALDIRAALTRAAWRVNPAIGTRYLPELTTAALAGRLGHRHCAELVGHLLWFGQVDQALAVLHTAQRGGAGAGLRHRLDDMRLWMARTYPGLPRSRRAERADPGGTVRRVVPSPRSVHDRVATLAQAASDPTRDDVVVRAEQILQGTRLDDHTVPSLVTTLDSLVLADHLDEAAYWCETLLKEATERGAPMWQARFASVKARIEVRLGGLTAAEESARTANVLVPAEGWGVALASLVAVAVYVNTAMGRLGEAADQLSVPVTEAAFQTPDGLLYLWARGCYYLAVGRPYAALDDFRACGDTMTGWGLDLPALVPWRTDAALAHLALGDERRARALAEEQLALVGKGAAWTRGVSLRVLARTLAPSRRLPLLGEAVEILQETGHRLELVRATGELARAHRELGDPGQARAFARRARQLAGECGIPVPEAPPSHTGMPAAQDGAGTPRTRQHPVELSDAELRVATLAARGLTNREIAAKLFITVSTVEQHLTRAYRKLDVQRRTDLMAKIASAPDPDQGPGHRHRAERHPA